MAALLTAVALGAGEVVGGRRRRRASATRARARRDGALDPGRARVEPGPGDVVVEAAGNARPSRPRSPRPRPVAGPSPSGCRPRTRWPRCRRCTLVAEARTIIGSYLGSAVPSRDIPVFDECGAQGRLPVEALVSSRITLDDINEGMDELADGHGPASDHRVLSTGGLLESWCDAPDPHCSAVAPSRSTRPTSTRCFRSATLPPLWGTTSTGEPLPRERMADQLAHRRATWREHGWGSWPRVLLEGEPVAFVEHQHRLRRPRRPPALDGDFFDADAHPEITFASTSVERDGTEWAITGDLTIKGTTLSVTTPFEEDNGTAQDPFGNVRIGFEGATTINRKDWDLTCNARARDPVASSSPRRSSLSSTSRPSRTRESVRGSPTRAPRGVRWGC